jgi:hypothetical protein
MKVLPVSFNAEHREMLGHTKMLLEKELVAINSRFNKLITSLRTAMEQDALLVSRLSIEPLFHTLSLHSLPYY